MGLWLRKNKFPEMRPFLLTAMVTVHKRSKPRTATLASAALHTNPPTDATSTKGFLSVRGVRGTSEEERKTRLTVSHAHGGEVEGTEFCLQTPQTNRKVTLHSDSIKRMLRQT